MIVLGAPAPSDAVVVKESVTGVVSNSGAGFPKGATLVRTSPQGLIFETETGALASGGADHEEDWGWVPVDTPAGEQFQALVAQLAKLG